MVPYEFSLTLNEEMWGGSVCPRLEKTGRENQGVVPSSGQTGQHSSWGITGLAQWAVSSQITSSHITVPLSHTQIWHGSGFQTSLSL